MVHLVLEFHQEFQFVLIVVENHEQFQTDFLHFVQELIGGTGLTIPTALFLGPGSSSLSDVEKL